MTNPLKSFLSRIRTSRTRKRLSIRRCLLRDADACSAIAEEVRKMGDLCPNGEGERFADAMDALAQKQVDQAMKT